MKLQINARGGWRDVVEFAAEQQRAVQEAALTLAQALAVDTEGRKAPKFRVTGKAARSPKVIAYLDIAITGPDWRKP